VEVRTDTGIDARFGMCVCGDLAPQCVRSVGNRSELRVRELLAGAGIRLVQRATRSHHLDDIGATPNRFPHDFLTLVGSLHPAAPTDSSQQLLAKVVIVSMSIRRADRIARGEYPRTAHDSVADRVAQAEDRVPLRAEVANRGEACQQRRLSAPV